MNRLLAKLPRSSSGSRDASANSSASRLPFDIFDVSITDAGACFCDFALVSSLICFSGASNDDFISFCHSERGEESLTVSQPEISRDVSIHSTCAQDKLSLDMTN